MSVILDALKKLERDKAACRKGPVDIVPQITIPRNRSARSSNWKIPAVIVTAVAVTAAMTAIVVLTLAEQGTRPVTAVSMDEENSPSVPSSPPARLQSEPQTFPEAGAGRLSSEAVKARPSERYIVQPAENAQLGFTSHVSKQPVEKNGEASISSGAAAPDLKVSGIAWQDERADRRAVVNGALVGEGAVVEGARIVRIYQDSVRFSRGGETFDKAVDGASGAK